MTVEQLAEKADFKIICLAQKDRSVSGAYVGDLLSWVMGKAQADNAWITIMSNINVIAVASLTDVACVILSENTALDNEALIAAEQKKINILSTPLSSYDIAVKISGII